MYLTVQQLSKRFITPGGQEILALQDLSFQLERGEILSILGPNGSGKTTLLNCLRQSLPFDQGLIHIGGQQLGSNGHRIVSVFQDVGLGVVGSMTLRENLGLIYSHAPGYYFSFPQRRFRSRIDAFLEQAGLRERFRPIANTPVSDLSGGQRQQLAIVMAVMRDPHILLLDEFVANLDCIIRNELLAWLRAWIHEHRVTTLMVTHDATLAARWGDRILELHQGKRIRFEPTTGDNNA